MGNTKEIDLKLSENYWIGQLADCLASPMIQRTSNTRGVFNVHEMSIPLETYEKFMLFSKEKDINVYKLFLISLSILISRSTGNARPVVAGSNIVMEGIPSTPGSSPIFFRLKLSEDDSVKELLKGVHAQLLDVVQNQDYSFLKFMERFRSNQLGQKEALHHICFTYEPVNPDTLYEQNFEINLRLIKKENSLLLRCTYQEGYPTKLIVSLMTNLIYVTSQLTDALDAKIQTVDVVAPGERSLLLYDFNDTFKEFHPKTIPGIIEGIADEFPNATALIMGDRKVSFLELNRQVNRVAHRLITHYNVKRGERIGVVFENSINLIVGLLAVLKSGAAYVPIDPRSPLARIRHVLSSSLVRVLLYDSPTSTLIQDEEMEKVDIDRVLQEKGTDDSNPPLINDLADAAYVVYTSGSTGKPKGAVITHRGLSNYINWFKNKFSVSTSDSTALLASYSFDLGYTSLWGAMLSGATLHLFSYNEVTNPDFVVAYYARHRLTILKAAPSYFHLLANYSNQHDVERCDALRVVVLGGENMRIKDMEKFLKLNPNLQFLNHYGHTETTIGTVTFSITKDNIQAFAKRPFVGRPIHNSRVYVLDHLLRPVPLGCTGEIFVSGKGVADGYFNAKDLTEAKFLSDPFLRGERMYRSGDLGRWSEDGFLEFLGRIDTQVKVKGYRIELREIENVILQWGKVTGVHVTTKQYGEDLELIAYLVSSQVPDVADLKDHISRILPTYMMPLHFVRIDKLPVTANGKIDSKALPDPNQQISTAAIPADSFNQNDLVLLEVWKNILRKESINRTDNFFSIGGDSIKAIQIAARLFKLGFKISMRDIFQFPTIQELSGNVKRIATVSDQRSQTGAVKLSPIQKAFFDHHFTDANHWNQAVSLFRKEGFDLLQIQKVLTILLSHHDTLRIVFPVGERQEQLYREETEEGICSIRVFDFRNTSNVMDNVIRGIDEVNVSFDLAKGPLIKFALLKTAHGDYFYVVAHHLIIDTVSFRILIEDFEDGYDQTLNGLDYQPPKKISTYRDWTERLAEYGNSNEVQDQLPYWKSILDSRGNTLSLKTRQPQLIGDTKSLSRRLSKTLTNQLINDCGKAYRTEINDLMLAALSISFRDWLGHESTLIRMEGHGREDLFEGINVMRTIGWFTSEFPVLITASRKSSLGELIQKTKQNLREIPHKGIGFGVLKYQNDQVHPALAVKPSISFNYLGELDRNEQLYRNFEVMPDRIGTLVSPRSEMRFPLEIMCYILKGELHLVCRFSPQQLESSEIERFMETYQENLSLIVDHCMTQYKSHITPADFSANDLDAGELENIFSNLENLGE